ncbi:MAG: glutamyl-tRNA reductase [Desulfobacterota bacterium]|nr:glutamyl-tRNA reductase [Thermodesulfobacteriota bacterium]
MHLIVAGLNHKTAPLELRERCAFSTAHLKTIYRELQHHEELCGAMVLVTCNRTECYASVRDPYSGFALLERMLSVHAGIESHVLATHLYRFTELRAVAHLFSVAAGLDSMILGEQEILGQVKHAYRIAGEAHMLDSLLNMFVQTALHVGKKVRAVTGIARYPVSVSAAAVTLCRNILTTLSGKHVLVVGAGDAGSRAVAALMQNGASSVIVSNRSFDHAQRMAAMVGGRAVHFDAVGDEIAAADIVISCTAAPHQVIRVDNCGDALRRRHGKEIVMIDIAVPRDIDPELGQIPGVFLYDIDDLQNVVAQHQKERLLAAHHARTMLECETLKFAQKLSSLPLVSAIAALQQYADRIAHDELEKALRRLDGGSDHVTVKAVLASLAHSIARRFVHTPITRLKERALSRQVHEDIDIINDLFRLDLQRSETDAAHQARNAR